MNRFEQTKLGKFKVLYLNKKEFHAIKDEIFGKDIYEIELDKEMPLILDLGAHIGVSVLYFKTLYPQSRIVAFEPNPTNFELLQENVFINGLDGVETINAAAHIHTGQINFYQSRNDEWFSNSSALERGWNSAQSNEEIKVDAVSIREFLNGQQSVDLVKMDIEGFEQKLIFDLGEKLRIINNMIIEFHNSAEQSFNKLRDFLISKEFKLSYFVDGEQVDRPEKQNLFIIKATRDLTKLK